MVCMLLEVPNHMTTMTTISKRSSPVRSPAPCVEDTATLFDSHLTCGGGVAEEAALIEIDSNIDDDLLVDEGDEGTAMPSPQAIQRRR